MPRRNRSFYFKCAERNNTENYDQNFAAEAASQSYRKRSGTCGTEGAAAFHGQKFSWGIIRQSIDARKKPDIYYVYTVDVSLADGGRKSEEKVLQRARNKNAALVSPVFYHFPKPGTERLEQPPVIVGTGPAGLFCGLMLARAGYRPILRREAWQ